MCESLESLIKVINENIKSEFKNISTEIEKISKIKDPEDLKSIDDLENLNDDLTLTLKIIRRSKLLRNKLNIIKSEINELSMFAYKPERIDTDDEEKWEKEEKYSKLIPGRLIKFKLTDDGKSEIDSKWLTNVKDLDQYESDSETESEIDN